MTANYNALIHDLPIVASGLEESDLPRAAQTVRDAYAYILLRPPRVKGSESLPSDKAETLWRDRPEP